MRAGRVALCVLAAVLVACPRPSDPPLPLGPGPTDPSGGGISTPRPGPNGADDLEYGADGLVLLDVRSGSHAVHDAVPLPAGGLTVLGRASGEPGPLGFVLRLGPDGRPMTEFGTGGVAEVAGWSPDRLVVAEDGTTTVVGGTTNEVAVAWLGPGGASLDETLVEVPVPDEHVAVGVQVVDAVTDADGLLVAGVIQVNREEDVGGCCAIEPYHVPFRLRLGADGAVDDSFGPGGFQLDDIAEGESGDPVRLPGTTPRTWRPELPVGAPTSLDPVVSVALDDGRTAVVGTSWREDADGSSATWIAVWAGAA